MSQINELVRQYVNLRDSIASKKKEFEDYKRECKSIMDSIELQLLESSNTLGVDSFKTDSGTAFKTTKSYAKMLDQEQRIAYAKRTGDYMLFTNHINKLHAIELLDEGISPDEIGVTVETEAVIQIRK